MAPMVLKDYGTVRLKQNSRRDPYSLDTLPGL